MSFDHLKLSEALLRTVKEEGYHSATPIQAEAIPHILEGRDVLGCAQTGTGKTAAFALPTIQRLASREDQTGQRKIRALILSPTRELANQISDSFRVYGRNTKLRHAVVFGGVGYGQQIHALNNGVQILVATPGRLMDLMNQGYVDLSALEIFILDEADQMLDMGFIHDIRRIVSKVPARRQTLLFSATMPTEIRKLADDLLRDPVSVSIAAPGTTADRVKQSVYFVDKKSKSELLVQYLKDQSAFRTLVFTRTKHGADKLAKRLSQSGIKAEAIHGNKSQNARQRAIIQFKSKKPPVLVATDIASRGLDIDDVSHVVNYDLPQTAEIYVHRIGRTARAGAEGIAITLCDAEERSMLREIQRLTRHKMEVATHEIARASDEPNQPENREPNRRDRRTEQRKHLQREVPQAHRPYSQKPRFEKPRRDESQREVARHETRKHEAPQRESKLADLQMESKFGQELQREFQSPAKPQSNLTNENKPGQNGIHGRDRSQNEYSQRSNSQEGQAKRPQRRKDFRNGEFRPSEQRNGEARRGESRPGGNSRNGQAPQGQREWFRKRKKNKGSTGGPAISMKSIEAEKAKSEKLRKMRKKHFTRAE